MLAKARCRNSKSRYFSVEKGVCKGAGGFVDSPRALRMDTFSQMHGACLELDSTNALAAYVVCLADDEG